GAPAGRGGSGMGRALRGRLRVVASALAVAGELLRVPRRAPARAVYHERRRGRAPELPAGAEDAGRAPERDGRTQAVLRDGGAAGGEVEAGAPELAAAAQRVARARARPL